MNIYFAVALLCGIISAVYSDDTYEPAYKLPTCSANCKSQDVTIDNKKYFQTQNCAWKDATYADCAKCEGLQDGKLLPKKCDDHYQCLFVNTTDTDTNTTKLIPKCKEYKTTCGQCKNTKNTSVVCLPFKDGSSANTVCAEYVPPPTTKAPASNGNKLAAGPIECFLLLTVFMMMSFFRDQQWKTI